MRDPNSQPPRRRKRRLWLFVLPLLGWMACLGLLLSMLAPLMTANRAFRNIPVTGKDPTGPLAIPTQTQTSQPQAAQPKTTPQKNGPVSGFEYMNQANKRLDACTSSFHDYFVLEQLVVDQPDMFTDSTWRSDVTNAMTSFRADCQQLGTLPSAPTDYAEIDRWLKQAAGEVGQSTDNLASAIDKERPDQFQVSVEHLLKFVEYIHKAEGAINGIKNRKET